MTIYTNSQPIIGAYGDVYTAPVGTPPPTIADWDDPPDWTKLGMVSEDGASWTPPAEETTDIKIWQSSYPVRTVTTGLTSSLTFALDAWDRVTVPFALGGGSFEDMTDTVIYHPPQPGAASSKAIFLKVLDGDLKMGLYFPKGRVVSRDDTTFKPDEAALLNVEFGLEVWMKPDGKPADPYQLVFDPVSLPPAGGAAVPATVATAGTPGNFNGTTQADLAAMATVTASPATAWTVGQYVVLGDASHAFWDSAAWQVGQAP